MSIEKLIAWVIITKAGVEKAFDSVPERSETTGEWETDGNFIELPKGTIKKMFGHKHPVSYKSAPQMCFAKDLPEIGLTTHPRRFIHENDK